jgi:hypothetical protein
MRALRWYRPQTSTLGVAHEHANSDGTDELDDIDDTDLAVLDAVVSPEIASDDDDEDDFFDDYLGGPIHGL